MSALAFRMSPGRTRVLLLVLYFVSGATGLAYQVLWVRELKLVFGASTFAVSTVVAAFMGGLAVGGFAMGRFADRLARPLEAYGLLEIGVGLYALLFPLLVTLATPVYLSVWRALEPGAMVFGSIQLVLVGSLLLLPTAAMGATLPLLARFAIRGLGNAGSRIGTLYSVNTLGAVAGAWLCGFALLPQIGRVRTTLCAAAANVLLGFAALALDRCLGGHSRVDPRPKRDAGPRNLLLTPVAAALALTGFSVLVYEVAWTRLLGLMLGGSTYSFSLMLIVFLLGIAVGGKLGGPFADRLLRIGGGNGLLAAFAVIQIGIALVSYAAMYLYPELPFWYVWLFDGVGAEHSPEGRWAVTLLLSALVMAPPAVLIGMHFPIAVRAVVERREALGEPVGMLYGASSLGGVLGAFLAGFVLLPRIGLQGTVLAAAAGELVAAGLVTSYAFRGRRRRWVPAASVGALGLAVGALFTVLRPPWNPMLMTAGLYQYVTQLDDRSREGIRRYSVELYDLLFYEEGPTSIVTVARNKGTSHLWLANNGKVDASTTADMPTQVLLSALPMQFVDDPEDILIIGLASGISAGVASLVPAVETLEISEIEPAVTRAARYFDAWNHGVLSDPRVRVVHNDARNHLLLARPGAYDVVVSEPSNPWISGVSNLFTREFLELGKSRLEPGGVWSQWLPMYGLDGRGLRSLLKTYADVYPHVLVYVTPDYSDLVLLGSDAPLTPDEASTARLGALPALTAELSGVGIRSPAELASLLLMDREAVVALAGDAVANTDDNMIIEFAAPLTMYRETRAENLELLMRYASLPAGRSRARAALANSGN